MNTKEKRRPKGRFRNMITSGKFWMSLDFVNKIGYNEYNNEGT